MPHIYIDDKLIEAKPNKTIIEVAFENGIDIPHFCWHPELTVAGNCRMCLVEVGMPKRLPNGTIAVDSSGKPEISYFPKLQIACATPVSDGMHVRTKSEAAINAQEAVMEFLLINHPLDCPICDEAGQCKLQEYAFNHSKGMSRFIETKNHKPKRLSWGPNVLFDAERCISCSRCIRFAKEIAHQDVLTFVQRGDHVTIELFENKEFDSPYSMNVIDICPVGALTSKDFRFKSRVWDMSFNDSICPGCARGCNTKLGVRNNEILRIEPRPNPYVNKFWMCDYGRLTQYEFVNNNRITDPYIKIDGNHKKVSLDEACNEAAIKLKQYNPHQIMFVGSAKATNEDNYILVKLAKLLNIKNIDFPAHTDENFQDDFLRCSDKTPNSIGAVEVGVKPDSHSVKIENLSEKIVSGDIKVLLVMEENFEEHPEIFKNLSELEFLIVLGYNHSNLTSLADIILPASTFAEIEGTYVNINRRVQHFTPAVVTSENLRFMGMKMSRLDKFGAFNDRWTQHQKRNSLQSWKIIQKIANNLNAGWTYRNSLDVFIEITHNIPSFKGMTYELLDEYQGLVLGKADKPDQKIRNYESHYMKPN